jgi:hypothetical protein
VIIFSLYTPYEYILRFPGKVTGNKLIAKNIDKIDQSQDYFDHCLDAVAYKFLIDMLIVAYLKNLCMNRQRKALRSWENTNPKPILPK